MSKIIYSTYYIKLDRKYISMVQWYGIRILLIKYLSRLQSSIIIIKCIM